MAVQQLVGLRQLCGVQVHTPKVQNVPAEHAGPPPQVQPTPAWQPSAMFGSQAAHALPLLPHIDTSFGAMHVVPLQQPFGQTVPSHTHAPETQCRPAAHGGPLPHWHVAPGAQVSEPTPQSMHAPPF
jgi:hypothetical protein